MAKRVSKKGVNMNKVSEVMDKAPVINDLIKSEDAFETIVDATMNEVPDFELQETLKDMSHQDALKRMEEDLQLIELKEELEESPTSDEVIDLAESVGNSLDDIDALREAITEQFEQELKEEPKVQKLQFKITQPYNNYELDLNNNHGDVAIKAYRRVIARRNRLDIGIYNAINAGKDKNTKSKFVPAGAITAISNNYRVLTGGYLSDEQLQVIKTLNPVQIDYINQTIAHAQSKVREQEFNKRVQQAQLKRQTVTA